jgi:autotransporter passenger strand-loop-strand repeat protein
LRGAQAPGSATETTVNSGVFYQYGGTASGIILNGGYFDLDAGPGTGGTTSGTTVNAGGRFNQYGGTATGTTVNAGGAYYVYGGTGSGTIVSGGQETLQGAARLRRRRMARRSKPAEFWKSTGPALLTVRSSVVEVKKS